MGSDMSYRTGDRNSIYNITVIAGCRTMGRRELGIVSSEEFSKVFMPGLSEFMRKFFRAAAAAQTVLLLVFLEATGFSFLSFPMILAEKKLTGKHYVFTFLLLLTSPLPFRDCLQAPRGSRCAPSTRKKTSTTRSGQTCQTTSASALKSQTSSQASTKSTSPTCSRETLLWTLTSPCTT